MKERRRNTQLDDCTCDLIIDKFKAGLKPSAIHRAVNIPRSTVQDCIDRWKKTGSGRINKRPGRPLKLSARDQRAIVRSFKEDPFLKLADRCEKLKTAGINVHTHTLRTYATKNGFVSKSAN